MSARICRECGQHPAIYIRRQARLVGKAALVVCAGKGHDLCPRCFRSACDRQRARGERA